MATPRPKTLLIFSQTFVPDPASVGQHMSDVAFEMARRGHPVEMIGDWAGPGSEQVIRRCPETGVLQGGADPRRESSALAW